MKRWPLWLALCLAACAPAAPQFVFLWDEATLYTLTAHSATPASLAAEAGLTLSPQDRFLFNGVPVGAESRLPAESFTLQIRRAVTFELRAPNGSFSITSSAPTLREALAENGYALQAGDFLAPPAETPPSPGLQVEYRPGREIHLQFANGAAFTFRSAAQTVGQALAEAGIPLLGLDSCQPEPQQPLPADGKISLQRESESLALAFTSLPFETEFTQSASLPLGVEELLTPGAAGVAAQITRIRQVNGVETGREELPQRVIVAPQNRVTGRGAQILLQTLDAPGGPYSYWRAISMYATSYSPCRSGVPGRCFNGTASGLPVQRGVVAVNREWYAQLAGTQVYIPGYGAAVIGDVGGGFPDGRAWVDLGYTDSDWQEWSGWVTVYFLAPAPAEAPYFLR